MLTVGSLFAGIGGFDLGFERAGLVTCWQVENDPFCLEVLARHFPRAKRHEDVRDVGRHNLEPVDVIAAGPPCQPVSGAGKGRADNDPRWLWPDALRVIGDLRPRYAVMENPAIFLGRGLDCVLGELAAIGYDAEWEVVTACAFGAPHVRRRLLLVAYPNGIRGRRQCGWFFRQGESGSERDVRPWPTEPAGSRVADGIPFALDRNRALGNALVPQIAEWLGRRILEWEEAVAA